MAVQLARRMGTVARAFLDALEPEQRAVAADGFDAADRKEWTYLPGPRPGAALIDMSEQQRALAMELLDTGLSEQGRASARAVMELESVLREIEQAAGREGWERRHPQHFWFRILGDPGGDEPWAWKVGGHHLAVHMTVVGDRVAGTPQFFGANPARVPGTGHRTLPEEEDLARSFLGALTPSQREMAISGWTAPRDIRTRHDPVADTTRIAHGLAYHHMHGEHRDLLVRLIRRYLDRVHADIADAAWSEIRDAGLDNVTFRWSGSTENEPGHAHYYAVLGPTFLLEYDNAQNDANHVHTVWRDLRHDWGTDLLAEHHRAHAH